MFECCVDQCSFENGQILPLRLTGDKKEKHVNMLCLHYFSSREKLQLHAMDYGKMNDCAIRLPSEDKWLDFGNYCNKERVSFIVYDLKCVLRKMELVREDARTPSVSKSRNSRRVLTIVL
ncbi:PREDICTED: uncharacterized protein LOC105146164 [Acromyrmex echinatior]|uniref:uncharacterized protein LOC105146164 n=1 Tax=Acromyrmex echinatior TaxID=103372 RepID=UPI000580C071|nr:PREDICTED: uncharacterized protein LOC105146164 [Acromyrmex echinatior]